MPAAEHRHVTCLYYHSLTAVSQWHMLLPERANPWHPIMSTWYHVPRSWSLPVSANELLWTKRAHTHTHIRTFAHDPTLSPGSIMSSQKHLHFSPREPHFSVALSAVYLLIVYICLLKRVLVAEETVYKFPPVCRIPGAALECPGRRGFQRESVRHSRT